MLRLRTFPSDFVQTSFSGSISFFSFLISFINCFAAGLNPLKKVIVFNDFEPVLMFLIAFNVYFLYLQLLITVFYFCLQYF